MGREYKATFGELVTEGWGGRQVQPVVIVGETPKRYRVAPVGRELRLPFRGNGVRKILRAGGGTVLVPKFAVRVLRTEDANGA